jgi:hypothetical protein
MKVLEKLHGRGARLRDARRVLKREPASGIFRGANTPTMKDNESKSLAASGRALRHVVAFRFKETTTPDQVRQIEALFRELARQVPAVAGFEWGLNNSAEGFDKGFTHGFIVTFRSEADRAVYLGHPEHARFVASALPVIADVFVLDFWAQA